MVKTQNNSTHDKDDPKLKERFSTNQCDGDDLHSINLIAMKFAGNDVENAEFKSVMSRLRHL